MGSLGKAVDNYNEKNLPKDRRAGPMQSANQVLKVGESLFDGDAKELLTGSPEKSGKITEAAFNVLTLGQAQGVGAKVGNVAKQVDSGVRKFFAGFDPTNTGIKAASTAGIDTAQAGMQGAGANSRALADALQKNGTKADVVSAGNIANASRISLPQEVEAERIAVAQAQMQQAEAARIAELERAQAAAIQRGDEQGVRASQMQLAEALQSQASGAGPSIAEMQLQRQNEQAIRQQLALAGSQRGMTPAMAQRQAAINVANLSSEQGARAAELRIQEQQAARSQLADVLGQTRTMDVNLAAQQAQLDQQAVLQNAAQANQQATTQAQLAQQVALANQGEFGQTSRFNVEQALKASTANAANALQSDQFNVTANQGAQQFNAKAQDEMNRFKTDAGLRASIANQAAKLQATGMDQAQTAKLLGIEQQSLQSVLQSETNKFTAEQARLTGEQKNKKGMLGNVISSVGSIVAMCFPAGERVLMEDTTYKNIEDVKVGDALFSTEVIEVRKYTSEEALYTYSGTVATGSHAVWTGYQWESFADAGVLVSPPESREVYALVTCSGVMIVGDCLCGDDEHDAHDLNSMERECA